MKKMLLVALCAILAAVSCKNEISVADCGGYTLVSQTRGRTLGTACPEAIIEADGFAFKDLDGNGVLDPYEDWRLNSERRAVDLASRMTVEEIAGLMIYSSHQKLFSDELSDYQKTAAGEDNMRHFLITKVADPATAARWNNNIQALAEKSRLGIPVNNSSDPRHGVIADDEFNFGAGGQISVWPGLLGMAATFDPATALDFGKCAAVEYRALGLATALSPQVDLATEPRWRRAFATFGEGPALAVDFARAYCDGFQTSYGSNRIEGAWGSGSVNAMVKHWPGGGTGESGRDAHFAFGKYAVYPGGNFEQHLLPFTKGAFHLKKGTSMASAVMPYYTISCGVDPSGENVANAYSKYIVEDLLRGEYAYDGVVCTDWGVVNEYTDVSKNTGKPWGLESLPQAELYYRVLMNSIDQFGGISGTEYIIEAYGLMCERNGEEFARARFEQSARRLLMNIFRTGLFDNPYLDPEESTETVGCAEFMARGFDAQTKSVIMLKNHDGTLPLAERQKVYVPKRRLGNTVSYWSGTKKEDAHEEYFASFKMIGEYYDVTMDPCDADAAIVFIEGPLTQRGYDPDDRAAGGNGYLPLSLQYGDYTAEYARETSLAGGDPLEDCENRSYRGKIGSVMNSADADIVRETREAIGADKPLILVVSAQRPFVPAEVEPYADAVLLGFEVQNQAYMEIISGRRKPCGLLPMQMPRDMKTVEEQCEDLPFDMDCYVDADGNVYDYAFGLDWNGKISDWRTKKYAKR